MRVSGRTQHVAGWMGGIIERAEPDRASTGSLDGRLRAAENLVHGGTGRLAVRGGARAALTLAEQAISNLVGVFRWSPTGALLVAHSATNDKHYAYALNPDGSVALPAGSATESGSRADMTWNVADPHWPQAAELFETLFVADTGAAATRQALKAIKLTGGALAITDVEADLDADTTEAPMKPSGVFVYGSVLFAYGWEDEAVGASAHILRHSLLAQDPAEVAGWDADAYATIGAQGEPITAALPGQDIALVAKFSELFRVFGSPEALPGWQFEIQPVQSSMRLGAVNQHAMCYEGDRWWGIGRDGPWVFDGRVGTSLVGPRRERWGQVGDLAQCFVEAHPRRGAVLFGFPEPASLIAGTRASRLWVFDTASDKWAPDFTFPSRFYMVRTVAETGVDLDDIPDDLVWVSEPETYEFDAFTMTFSPGDVSALTEVWVQPAGGSFALAATLPAGLNGFRVGGVPRGASFSIKLRHRKGDALTEFGSAVAAYTQIDPPRLVSIPIPRGSTVNVSIPDAGRTLAYASLDSYEGNNVAGAIPALPAGVYALDLAREGGELGYGALPHLTVDLELSQGLEISPPVRLRNAAWFAPTNNTFRIAVSQQLAGGLSADSIEVFVVAAHSGPDVVLARVEYRPFGTFTWITHSTSATYVGSTAFSTTISGLDASQRYEVRARTLQAGTFVAIRDSEEVVMFTRIAAPTATISTAGAGTPVTNIAVIPPGALAGFDTMIINADGTFDALYPSVSTAETTYQSTAGVCGRVDRYWVRARSTAWPDGYQYSAPVELEIANPCVIS